MADVFPEGQVREYLYGAPCDMRRSFKGLIALTKNAMGQDPLSGHLFVFVNRRGNILKSLYWDRSGFCICTKRLSAGKFNYWPSSREEASASLQPYELSVLLSGGDPYSAKGVPMWRRVDGICMK